MYLFLILHFLCNYKSEGKNKAASHDDLVVLGHETIFWLRLDVELLFLLCLKYFPSLSSVLRKNHMGQSS